MRIVLVIPGLPADPQILRSRSLGGAETAGVCMADALRRVGHQVTVFSNGTPGDYDGVEYLPLSAWQEYATQVPHDVTVIQRMPEWCAVQLTSHLRWLWCHDMGLVRQAPVARGVLWAVDAVLALSRYHADQLVDAWGLPRDAVYVTRNGVDLRAVDEALAAAPRQRDPVAVYAARPERGLDVLLEHIWPRVVRREPRAVLWVCGYENPTRELVEFYARIRELMARTPNVHWLGHLTKSALYAHYARASVYLYPTPSPVMPLFREVSCISAMEAQACGLPVVTARAGALPETVAPGAGTLVDGDPVDQADAYAEAALRYLCDPDARERAGRAGRSRAQALDWSGVARDWSQAWERALRERAADPVRTALHFVRRSDIVVARHTLRDADGELAAEVRGRIDRHWGWADRSADYRMQYEAIGQTHVPNLDAARSMTRFGLVRDWIAARPQIRRVLDVGCAEGTMSVGLLNELPQVQRWVAVDIAQASVQCAQAVRDAHALRPDAMSVLRADGPDDLGPDGGPFDLLFVGETLEHVPCPWEWLDSWERCVAPGGWVLLTVPYGPWEYLTPGYAGRPDPDPYPFRAHLWEFSRSDLHDMLADKEGVEIVAVPGMRDRDRTGEVLGHYLVSWRRSDPPRPARPIDLERKRWQVNPRQTVSAMLIAGPGCADTLGWCLRSLVDVADEIVIGDCGMRDDDRRLAQQFGARIVSAPDPLQAGFDAARNAALDACRMDWVLWIDTDERLVNPAAVHKYLRANVYDGYQISQHHFAVDTTFPPDRPVRLFRRRPRADGVCMRFWGRAHEHPEYAIGEGPGLTVVLPDVHIAHVGYLSEWGRRAKFWRNLPLVVRDAQDYPDRQITKLFLMRDEMHLVTYELEHTGGRVTPAVRERCRRVLELWRTHFRGRAHYLSDQALEYVTAALRVLGEGVEVSWTVVASKDGHQSPPVQHSGRFATADDVEAELSWRVRQVTTPLASPYW
ncbi:MAG: glycosyltransferase [Armatimonadota bacterium]|nr:glycosyltransferase [Armatimonadota bacterium]